jgi:hypothetical protein
MQYLKIENPGVNPIEAFTTLGVSLSRYSNIPGTIGEKGSGSKHAVLLLLRNKIKPLIYCGSLGLEYYSKPMPVKGAGGSHTFNVVHYRLKGKTDDGGSVNREEKTSYTLEFGTADWTEIAMGLREFVSNALDASLASHYHACGQNIDVVGVNYVKDVCIELVDENQVRARAGYTRIFVPATDDVIEFYETLGQRFLHFSEPLSLKMKVLPKSNRNIRENSEAAVLYKKGVLVREIRGYAPSLFDYNLGDELQLDDSRNIEDYRATDAVCVALRDAEPAVLAKIFQAMIDDERMWETTLHGMQQYYEASEEVKEGRKARWNKALEMAAGPNAVLVPNIRSIIEMVEDKGMTPVITKDGNWREAAEEFGARSDVTVLSKDERDGRTFSEAPDWLQTLHDRVWDTIVALELTNGKEKPSLRLFKEITEGRGIRTAFYDTDTATCNFNEELIGDNLRTHINVLEEIGHHVTGSQDYTREFQDYFIRLATIFMQREWQRDEC